MYNSLRIVMEYQRNPILVRIKINEKLVITPPLGDKIPIILFDDYVTSILNILTILDFRDSLGLPTDLRVQLNQDLRLDITTLYDIKDIYHYEYTGGLNHPPDKEEPTGLFAEWPGRYVTRILFSKK